MFRPLAFGTLALLILLGVYIVVVSLVSGWTYMLKQLAQYWYFVVTLAVGFGVQVALFTYLRSLQQKTRGVVAVSGTTTTVAMLSCCSHYVANLIPILGVAGAITLIGQYQIELFWFGIAANMLGIVYMVRKLFTFKNSIPEGKVEGGTINFSA